MTDRFKRCRSNLSNHLTFLAPYLSLRDCVAFNIPVFRPVDSKNSDIKTTAMSGFASYTFIVKKQQTVSESVVIQ